MNTDRDRIRLAEAMGYTVSECGSLRGKGPLYGQFVFRGDGYGMADIKLWNPYTDANDTDALVRWLNERGCDVQVMHLAPHKQRPMRALVQFSKNMSRWTGDDWKTGVCELALKVLDNE